MTMRDRFIDCCKFEPVDRVPNHELGLWGQTYDRWLTEGMPAWAMRDNWFEGIDYFGMDRREFVHVDLAMMPGFTPEVLEEDDRYVTARNGQGIVTKALKEGTVHGTRMSMDQYLSFAVQTPADFQDLKRRYLATEPQRYPSFWDSRCAGWANRDHVLCLCVNCAMGLYSNLRVWMGTENLSYAFYDQPALVHEMVEFVADFTLETVHKALDDVQFDYFNYFEDFAGKGGPLLGPAVFREFFLPHYQRMNDLLREHGVSVISLDSDGNTEALIPLLIEAGITAHWPCEIASDMEPLRLRQEYGHDLALWGGIDKRELAKDRAAIEHEVMRKVPALIEDGGYIPTIDHTVQPDVPYDNFLYYMELKEKCLAGEV
jgi:uroporphyrinogen decarboxylase